MAWYDGLVNSWLGQIGSNAAKWIQGQQANSQNVLNSFKNYFLGQSDLDAQVAGQKELLEAEQKYNSAEAQLNRDWQEKMSNSAIQRQVADLKAAGLNPWLALQNGMSGASVGSGAMATSSAGSAGQRTPKWSQLINAANQLIGQGRSFASSEANAAMRLLSVAILALAA